MNTPSRNPFQAPLLTIILAINLLIVNSANAQSVGDKVALSDFTTFEGSTVKADDLKGRPVLLYFWASWCPICVNEMPLLKRIYTKHKDKGFEILAVSFREEPEKSQAFFKRHGFEFPGGPIDAAHNTNFPGIRGTPTWLLIDRDGVVRRKIVGSQDIRWELEKGLAPLL